MLKYMKKEQHMNTKFHLGWLEGYTKAVVDVGLFLKDNKKLMSPSAYKTFVKRLAVALHDHKRDQNDFMEAVLGGII